MTTTSSSSNKESNSTTATSSTITPPIIVALPEKGIKVNATQIAKPFRHEIKEKIENWRSQGIEAPLLVGLLANKDPAAKKYAEWTGKACESDGIRYELRTLDDPIDVETALLDANDDPRVHGIIVYYPIFGQQESFSGTSQDDYLRDTVSYRCDVEGLCHFYRTNLYRNIRYMDYPINNQKCLLPCTALSVVKILESCPGCYDKKKPIKRHMEGKIVTVINRSEIVGRPLAAMLSNDGAIVYSVDINSIYMFRDGRLHHCITTPQELEEKKKEQNEQQNNDQQELMTPESCVRKSSIVITGVPTKEYRLPTEWVQPYTTVINVASYKNVDEESLLKIPGVVYVPMVGKVTVAMLERNLIRLFEQFHLHPTYIETTTNNNNPILPMNTTTKDVTTSANSLYNALLSSKQQQSQPNNEKEGRTTTTTSTALQIYTAIAVTALVVLQAMQWTATRRN